MVQRTEQVHVSNDTQSRRCLRLCAGDILRKDRNDKDSGAQDSIGSSDSTVLCWSVVETPVTT
jgi:hypothetical protein